jgi:hypothetical protein
LEFGIALDFVVNTVCAFIYLAVAMLFSPLLFNSAVECINRKVQESQVRLKLNGTRELLAYAEDLNLQGENIEHKEKHRNCK